MMRTRGHQVVISGTLKDPPAWPQIEEQLKASPVIELQGEPVRQQLGGVTSVDITATLRQANPER
jgi:hypothetical protein